MNKDMNQKPYQSFSPTFVSVSGDKTSFTLGEIKLQTYQGGEYVDGGATSGDFIQFIDPGTSKVDNDKIYYYYGTYDGAEVGGDYEPGWYTTDGEDTFSNDVAFPVGTAFLTAIDSNLKARFSYSGQVLTGDVTIDTCTVDSSTKEKTYVPYMFVANPLPIDLTLASVKLQTYQEESYVDGGATSGDFIQFIDPSTSKVDNDKIYYYYGTYDGAEVGGDYEPGWYTTDGEDTFSNSQPLPAGEGVLCAFDTNLKARLVFTNPVK